MATIELSPGARLLDDRYHLDRLLGTGGMASVWLAHDLRLGRPVAIKIIADALAADPAYRMRFEREARIAAGLTHPGLVGVYDYAADAARPVLVMEYVAGGTIADRLARGSSLDAERLADELLDALGHIHEAGIVHRDIKPANVLIGEDGRVRLTDFGIAYSRDAAHLTQTGDVVGTVRYLAPEVLRGEPATPASDLYALGMLLEEAAGAAPSARLRELITALSARLPAHRPPSAAHARGLLDAPPPVPAPTPPDPSPPPEARPPLDAPPAVLADAPPRRTIRVSRHQAALALLVALGAVVLLALNIGAGEPAPTRPAGSDRPATSDRPASAPAEEATVGREIDRLERIVRRAAER